MLQEPDLARFDVLFEKAAELHASGKLQAAVEIYSSMLRSYPDDPRLLNNLGDVALKLGKLTEAHQLLGLSIKANPNQPFAFFNLGNCLRKSRQYGKALVAYDRAIELKRDYWMAHFRRASVLHRMGRLELALDGYGLVIALNPTFGAAFNNMGNVLYDLKRYQEALASFGQAIALRSVDAISHYNRGNVLKALLDFDGALASYNDSIALRPQNADAYNNRGIVLQALGRLNEAATSYDHAISLDPKMPAAHWNKATVKLLAGEFEEGLPLYEWRWQDFAKDHVRHFAQPLWLGEQELAGHTLLVHGEQGLGDVIQCSRYLPLLRSMGAEVVLEVATPLVSLLQSIHEAPTVIARGSPLPAFDLHCPIMSLPLAFKTTVNTIPASVPYLSCDSTRMAFWSEQLGPKTSPRIGLAWSGSPTHLNDQQRSMPLDTLAPLLMLPFEFHALQKELRIGDAAQLLSYPKIAVHDERLADMAEAAALVMQMDLVITVDTSIAHLAGALGKPVWVLLSQPPDFRWMMDRDDSPWYPTATLIRQANAGNWQDVIGRVVQKLASYEFLRS